MSDKSEATVIGSLPHSRPRRRSALRAARPEQETNAQAQAPAAKRKPVKTSGAKAAVSPTAPAAAKAETRPKAAAAAKAETRPKAPATPKAGPRPSAEETAPRREQRPNCPSSIPEGAELIGTVVKAAAELVEIGLTVGARALRTAVLRLPRP
jgi:hypothetical protein